VAVPVAKQLIEALLVLEKIPPSRPISKPTPASAS
jgi:hypothetical protein